MQWFVGPIHDAISAAKKEKKIFLVFVEGKDETSKNMTEKIMEKEISEPLNENCVSIKLATDSEAFRQFSQIYPVIVVPSMFFIGNNGIPLEVIAGSENQDDLAIKAAKAIKLHKLKLAESAVSTSAETAGTSSSTTTTTVPVEEQNTGQPSTTEETVASAPTTEAVAAKEEQTTTDEPQTLEEAQALLKQKMERAEQLIAERRRIREQEEKEAEKQRELEQRRVSREFQKAREQMKDKEMADWAKQRQKEKQEDKEARQRVLEKIAQDKADRAAKLQNSGSSPPSQAASSSSVRQRSPQDSVSNSEVTRIQFRLPNSVTCNHEFPSGATLRDVINHVQREIKPNLPGFSLATSFPRRHFSKADHVRTLRDLDLSPSAVLLVLPASAANPAQNSGGGGLWALFWTILSPLTLVWNFIYSFIFGNRTNPSLPSSAPQQGQSTTGGQGQPTTGQGQQNSTESSRNKSGPDQKANPSRYRKDGNIHRLSNESSNDDEDGTWNGNSTQQM